MRRACAMGEDVFNPHLMTYIVLVLAWNSSVEV